jgi:hypothetical protein
VHQIPTVSFTGAEDLLERAEALVLPKNPLDDLIERLGGPDAVAEMTGRQKRMERQPKGGYSYVSRAAQYGRCSLDDVSQSCCTGTGGGAFACLLALLGGLMSILTRQKRMERQ